MKLSLGNIHWPSVFTRGAIFAFFWWVLTEGDAMSWKIGLPAVVAATIVSIITVAPAHLRWLQALRLIPFFVKRSVIGATDVSLRALRPSLPLAPMLVAYPLTIPPSLARMVLLNVISLLPGTLCADIRDDTLFVHVLDSSTDYNADLAEVERAVAKLYANTTTELQQNQQSRAS